tara:strand:- start:47 stop:1105 length:1059 start_codon:yes stop_codon:yes gene_type:complete
MNITKEFNIFIDDYNHNHQDAILMIADFLSKKKNLKAEAMIFEESYFAIKASDGKISYIIKTNFYLNSKSTDELKNYFIKLLYRARKRFKNGYSKTKIEIDIEKSLTSKSFFAEVKKTRCLSKNLKEIVFSGDFRNLEISNTDDFMLVIVPHKEGNFKITKNYTIKNFRRQNFEDKKQTAGAYYTIRQASNNEIVIWFVIHNHLGNLGDWAKAAEINDSVVFWGPRSLFNPPKETKHFILISDETGLPAIQSISENCNSKINCQIFCEVIDENCRIPLSPKKNLKENWVYRNEKGIKNNSYLLDKLKKFKLPTEDYYIFGAGEASQMMEIRNYFKNNGVKNEEMNISGYWKK